MRHGLRILAALAFVVLAGCGDGDEGGAIEPGKETIQPEETKGILEVAGARLYYEVRGEGPLLVVVPGRKSESGVYRDLARELSARSRVVSYDRRGFSRSRLVGAQDYERRLATDADDVRRLIEHVGDERAVVFGNSSGGLVALEVLARHPDVVRTVIAHEPPAVRLLPDGQQWVAFFEKVYATYREAGVDPALKQFAEGTGIAGGRGPASSTEANSFDATNDLYWFERELRQYPNVELDVEALTRHADRLVLAGGRESGQNVSYRPNTVLAERMGKNIVEFPGGHVGMVTHPTEFARELLAVLGG